MTIDLSGASVKELDKILDGGQELRWAREEAAARNETQSADLPLRYRYVVVYGPNEKPLVVTLGFATANELEIVK